ncbi:MAG: hypothetical protein KME13_24310 [Myxacorys californica WJT36-NPBG1]|jgi:hypothetical protein|nr:hypothetical protein [Myxacorys californica WJT36-NPBG1]
MSKKEQFDMAREIIKHEDNLVNNRVTWLLVLQGFLFTAFVNGIGMLEKVSDYTPQRIVAGLVLVGLLGIVTSLIARNTILVAYDHTNKVESWWNEKAEDSIRDYPPVRGIYPTGRWYRLLSTSKMPYLFVAVWTLLIALVVCP